jgi:hypothetical protein
MIGQEEYVTDEFFRYAAECRRMARCARPPGAARQAIRPLKAVRWREWLHALAGRYLNPAGQHLALRTVRSGHR